MHFYKAKVQSIKIRNRVKRLFFGNVRLFREKIELIFSCTSDRVNNSYGTNFLGLLREKNFLELFELDLKFVKH